MYYLSDIVAFFTAAGGLPKVHLRIQCIHSMQKGKLANLSYAYISSSSSPSATTSLVLTTFLFSVSSSLSVLVCFFSVIEPKYTVSSGPIILKITGNKIKPCDIPNTTNVMKAMKTVVKISLLLKASGMVPKKVVIPPIRTDEPILRRTSITFSFRLPGVS